MHSSRQESAGTQDPISVEKLRELRNNWQGNQLLQNEIESAFDALGFTREFVERHTSSWYRDRLPQKSKQLKDNQWGMIDFDWRAMRLIDSPIIQRLRYVKQLGFTYLTYPSAEHSRFSHTLGVAHVIRRFIEAIDKRAAEGGGGADSGFDFVAFAAIPDLYPDDLIHAALLHDVGHLPFSHVTEKILESQPGKFKCAGITVSKVIFETTTILKCSVKFAEILTLMLILSKRFEAFYYGFVRVGDTAIDDALLRIGSLIVGLPPSPHLTGLPELISSASVDADKVDYVNRDALNCGVPVGVDVARIFMRSGIVKASQKQMAKLELKDEFLLHEYLFVVNSSGIDTIEEILQARTALFQRVYFHAVTRTAERLLSRSLEANVVDAHPNPMMTDALKLWSQKDGAMLDALSNAELKGVKEPALQVINRQFPKKAYSFSPAIAGLQMPVQQILPKAAEGSLTEIRKQVNNTTIEKYLRDEHLWKGNSKAIEEDIVHEAAEIVKALVAADKREAIPRGPIRTGPSSVLVVGTAHEKQKYHNQIVAQGDRLLTLREYTNAREQQVAFELLKEVGFVLCEGEWRQIVFFAARVVLARLGNTIVDVELKFSRNSAGSEHLAENVRFITRFLPEYSLSLLRSGLPAKSMRRVASDLSSSGYFEDKPWACEPLSATNPDVANVAGSLAGFDGHRSWRVPPIAVASFVSQFPPSLRQPMLDVLTYNLDFLSAQRSVELLAPLLSTLPKPCHVVPFSSTSGHQIWTWLKKELSAQEPQLHFAADVAAAGDDGLPIVFVDDNASSGVQACAQFLSYLRVPKDRWPPASRRETGLHGGLEPGVVASLVKRKIYLAVCAGRSEAGKLIEDSLRAEGINGFSGLHFGTTIGADINWPSELKTFLTDVGRDLIAESRFGTSYQQLQQEDAAECDYRAFGYGNVGALLFTSISVPTATATAFWQPGLYKGQPWVPLAIRTDKLKDLVIG